MIHERNLQVLKKLLSLTQSKKIQWKKDEVGDWYSAQIGEKEICFRFLYFEANNQIGADPMMFEIFMGGLLHRRYGAGTEGSDLIYEILATAFPKWRSYLEDNDANMFLDKYCTEEDLE